jgi:hypothetical protein
MCARRCARLYGRRSAHGRAEAGVRCVTGLVVEVVAGVTSTVVQAYRFAVDPTPEQDAALRSHCGGQRFAVNWGLALVKANLDQRKAEASYGIGADQLTPSLLWSAYSLRKSWKQTKNAIAPWWAENSNGGVLVGPG